MSICLCPVMAELNNCDRGHMAHKTKNICYLTQYRKCLLVPSLSSFWNRLLSLTKFFSSLPRGAEAKTCLHPGIWSAYGFWSKMWPTAPASTHYRTLRHRLRPEVRPVFVHGLYYELWGPCRWEEQKEETVVFSSPFLRFCEISYSQFSIPLKPVIQDTCLRISWSSPKN